MDGSEIRSRFLQVLNPEMIGRTMKTLKLENQNAIWTLTIHRPESMNALNSQVLEELSGAVKHLADLPFSEAKCLIITGAGEKAFVAGADIKEISTLNVDTGKKFASAGQNLFRQLENLKIPVIAAVNGFALGGGLELALSCDFIYASDNAKFGLPEVTLGLIPGFGGTVRLARALNLPKAKEWIMTGNMMGAAEAFQMGLVNKVMSLAELMPAARKTAETIASRGPIAVASAKKSVQGAYDLAIDSAMELEASQFSGLFQTTDVIEGTTAFIEKRKAQFLGK